MPLKAPASSTVGAAVGAKNRLNMRVRERDPAGKDRERERERERESRTDASK